MYGHHIQQDQGSTGQGCKSCPRSPEQGKLIFPCPRSRLRTWSRETGPAVPSRASLLISIHTQAESGAHLRDSSRFPRQCQFIYLNRHAPSDQSRVYRVITQLRTDGVHCRESRASNPQGSSKRVLPSQVIMKQLISVLCISSINVITDFYLLASSRFPLRKLLIEQCNKLRCLVSRLIMSLVSVLVSCKAADVP